MTEAAESVLQIGIDKIKKEIFDEILNLCFQCVNDADKVRNLSAKTEELAGKCNVDVRSVKYVVKQLVQIISDGAGQNWSQTQFRLELEKLGLDGEKIAAFFKMWEEKQFEVTKTLLSSALSNNRLVDMEWKFGVTAASSECNKIGSTFLQLKLVIDKGDRLENVHIELSLPQFYTFMHEMERAKASMEFFS